MGNKASSSGSIKPPMADELLDYYAVGQCTPGVIADNTATFIGYKLRGITGGIIATIGVVFPSLIIILTIKRTNNYNDNNEYNLYKSISKDNLLSNLYEIKNY